MRSIKATTTNGSCSGFSLIEVVTAVSIVTILLTAVLFVFISLSRQYRKEILANREGFYAEEAMRFMENEILKGNGNVNVISNVIELTRMSNKNINTEIDFIQKSGSNLVIICTKGGYHQATNVFLRDIVEFMAEKSDSAIVITIVTSKGNRYRRCVNTQYVG